MHKFARILLIDDDPITILVCERMIQITNFGDKIDAFKNGLEAMEQIEAQLKDGAEEMPEVIFVDLNMPVMNGWEFLERFNTLSIPSNKMPLVYILSSTVDCTDQANALSYPFVKDFISKPLTKEHLENIKPNVQ